MIYQVLLELRKSSGIPLPVAFTDREPEHDILNENMNVKFRCDISKCDQFKGLETNLRNKEAYIPILTFLRVKLLNQTSCAWECNHY